MSDLLARLKFVATNAQIGVDPTWLQTAITEIERLRAENLQLAHTLMSPLVYVHETIINQVDEMLKPYIGQPEQD